MCGWFRVCMCPTVCQSSECVLCFHLPANKGIAGCKACGRCHGAEQRAGSGACGGSGASLGRGTLPPPVCGGWGCPPGPTPPNPSAHWKPLPQSTWCCWRTATEPEVGKYVNWYDFKCEKCLKLALEEFASKLSFTSPFLLSTLSLTWVPKPKEPTLSSVIRLFWRNTRCDS